MKTSDAINTRSLEVNHKTEMKNVKDRHKNEKDRLENDHKNNMAKLRVANSSQINNIKTQHDAKLIQENLKQEERLQNMKESLDKVKTHTDKEMASLKSTHEVKKENEQQLFEANYQVKKGKHQMMLQDLDQEANIELQKLNRRYQRENRDLKSTQRVEQKNLKNNHITKMNMKKDEFNQKKMHAEGKFANDLRLQKKKHTSHLVKEEQDHQTTVKKRQNLYSQQQKSIENIGQARSAEIQRRYEGRYNKQFKKNEFVLQQLGRKKEKIINDIKNVVKKEVALEVRKDKDPFYQNTTITPKLTKNENNTGYTLEIKVPKHDAKNFQLTGSKRQLKLSMDRNYEFSSKDANGSNSVVKKAESYTTKIPVDQIIEPNSIKRTYNEGVLKFTIGLA